MLYTILCVAEVYRYLCLVHFTVSFVCTHTLECNNDNMDWERWLYIYCNLIYICACMYAFYFMDSMDLHVCAITVQWAYPLASLLPRLVAASPYWPPRCLQTIH